MEKTIQERITTEVRSADVVMYVKGTPQSPQCGFSRAVMKIFEDLGVPFKTIDVLAEPEIREGIKEFTQWPTIPQIFIKGEFVGGCDIIRDLAQSGELKKMVKDA